MPTQLPPHRRSHAAEFARVNGGKKDIAGGFINAFIGQYCNAGGSPNWGEWLTRFK